MQKIRVPQNSFQFGEVSNSLGMRSDTPIYSSSARSLKNMIVMSEGSAKKRHGLKFIADLGAIGTGSVLFNFEFSDDEQYLISVRDGAIQVFHLNILNNVVTSVSTLTSDTDGNALPFDTDYADQYTFAQYGDVMFICHPLFMPRMLIRTGLTSFQVVVYSFDQSLDGSETYQPYYSFQPHGVTLDPSGTTGTVNLTTSISYFTPAHIGTIIRYGEAEIEITSFVSVTQVVGSVRDELKQRLTVLNPLRTSSGSNVVEVTQLGHGFGGGEVIVLSQASATGGINAANLNGVRTVGDIIDDNTYTFTAGGSASSSEDGGGIIYVKSHAPTVNWSEQSYSAVRGYPAAVVFHENRLCFAGTISQPDSIWMSRVGGFFNFNVGEAADSDSIAVVAATGQVNEIRYMVSNRDLQVFGASGELYIPTYLNQAITPTNAQVRLQTPFGCNFVQPTSIDGATIFVQNGGHVVREFLYTDVEDAYSATAISTTASHLIDKPRFMAVSHGAFSSSESYAFMTINDGTIALFNSNRAEKRASWMRIATDGEFHAVCAVHERTFALITEASPTGASTVKLCEFVGEIGLDQYVSGTIIPAPFGNAGYLNVSERYVIGDTVDVVSDDGTQHYGQFPVVAGPTSAGIPSVYFRDINFGNVHAGLAFEAKIESNPVDAALGYGPATGDIRGISTVVLDLVNTESVKVNDRTIQLPDGFSGKKEYRLLGYSRDPIVTISQNEPLPLQVNGFVSEVIV